MPFESYNWKRFGKIFYCLLTFTFYFLLTILFYSFSYFIAVFRRAFYDKHFDIIVNGAWSHCLELKLSAYFQNTDAGTEFPKNVFQIIMG